MQPSSNIISDKIMLFAAGFGKRMAPLTKTTPKPLIKVNGKALLDYALDYINNSNFFNNIIINCHYLSDQIKDHIKQNKYKDKIIISYEEEILETGGGIVNILPNFENKAFFCVNSDVIFIDNINSNIINNMKKYWNPNIMDALLLLYPIDKLKNCDLPADFSLQNNGQISRENKNLIFTGLQILKSELFENYKIEPFSLKQIYNDSNNRLYGIKYDGDWLHIGTKEQLEKAEEILENY